MTSMPDSLRPPSIGQVVGQYDLNSTLHAQIVAALTAREDDVADVLRAAGLQFGLYPEIVAEVFAEVGIGSPISDEQRQLVRNQFNALMDRLREEHERGHGTEQP